MLENVRQAWKALYMALKLIFMGRHFKDYKCTHLIFHYKQMNAVFVFSRCFNAAFLHVNKCFHLCYAVTTWLCDHFPWGSLGLPALTPCFVRQKPGVMWWSESTAGGGSGATGLDCGVLLLSVLWRVKECSRYFEGKKGEDGMRGNKTFMIAPRKLNCCCNKIGIKQEKESNVKEYVYSKNQKSREIRIGSASGQQYACICMWYVYLHKIHENCFFYLCFSQVSWEERVMW